MDRAKLRAELGRDEGVRYQMYHDSLGVPTIGIGHNLQVPITPAAVAQIFDDDVKQVIADLDLHIPWWTTLDEVRQRVLINMCFNLGIKRFLLFKATLRAVQAGQWEMAAEQMFASLWAHQVGDGPGGVDDRADRLTRMMLTGVDA